MKRTQLKTLLYVDDDADIREIVEMALGMIDNVSVHTCASGEKALSLIPTLKPDLILLDVMMPDMDGPTVFSRISAGTEQQNCPVIFVTAKALSREVSYFRELGAAGVIAKPFDPMELGRQVLQIWECLNDQ